MAVRASAGRNAPAKKNSPVWYGTPGNRPPGKVSGGGVIEISAETKAAAVRSKRGTTAKLADAADKAPLPPLKNGLLLGWAVFIRNEEKTVERVASEGLTIALSTSSKPQVRVRAASKCRKTIAGILEEHKLPLKVLKDDLPQYRALLLMGAALLVKSGEHAVVLDRHPDCQHDVVDAYLDQVRRKAKGQAGRSAKRAADNSDSILERQDETDARLDKLVRLVKKGVLGDEQRAQHQAKTVDMLNQILERQPKDDRLRFALNRLLINKELSRKVDWDIAVAELVAALLDKGRLDPEQQAFIDSLLRDEDFKARVEEKRKYTAAHLERY